MSRTVEFVHGNEGAFSVVGKRSHIAYSFAASVVVKVREILDTAGPVSP